METDADDWFAFEWRLHFLLLEEEWNITKDFRYFKAWMRICICECFEIRKEYYEYVLQK